MASRTKCFVWASGSAVEEKEAVELKEAWSVEEGKAEAAAVVLQPVGGGGGVKRGRHPGLSSDPHGVGSRAPVGMGICTKRPFSAPLPGQGFREGLGGG